MNTQKADNPNSNKISQAIKEEPLTCCECSKTLKHINDDGEVRVMAHYYLPSGVRCQECYIAYKKWQLSQII
ncbi:hypothetical protein ISS06_00060 [Patescibacteria group bacterium]|nr:hypothetical protein [Patescibacteria group bacterium]